MMESVARNGVVAVSPLCHLKPQAISSFKEGISTILSQWRALHLDPISALGSRAKDLENLLHECLLFTFNTEIEDGSIEEVAEQLMVLHEEILARESLIRYYDC